MIVGIRCEGYRLTHIGGVIGFCIPLPLGYVWCYLYGPSGLQYGLWRVL